MALLAGLGAGGASAQEPVLGGDAAAAAPTSPWASQCVAAARSATLDCSMFQRVVTQAGQLVGSVTIRMVRGTEWEMVLSAPLGLHVPSGISFSVDGSAVNKLDIQTCDQGGCMATRPVSADDLGAMAKGQKMDIMFSNVNGQAITLPLSLAGFTAAYDRVK